MTSVANSRVDRVADSAFDSAFDSAVDSAIYSGSDAGATLDPPARLERLFCRILAERMQDMPLNNDKLGVQAVGFRRWEGRWLGVLITPWFMNLVLLPDEPARWQPLPMRETWGYAFPAGVFDFLGNEEPGFGPFQTCSLFSPMFDFADDAGARATALAALDALFDPGVRQVADDPRLPGNAPSPEAAAPTAAVAEPALTPAAGADTVDPSRRRFLGGGRSAPREAA